MFNRKNDVPLAEGATTVTAPEKRKGWKTVLKWVVTLIVVVVAYVVGTNVGAEGSAQQALLESKQSADAEYQDIQNKIEESQPTLQAIEDYNTNKEKYQDELTDLQNQIDGKKTELSNTKSDLSKAKDDLKEKKQAVSDKQKELDKLTGEVVKASGRPITVPSGDYTIGTDIKAGRYRVSGSSNFVAYTSAGRLSINTILGNSSVGSGDYVSDFTDGMTVRCSSRTTFTPVE